MPADDAFKKPTTSRCQVRGPTTCIDENRFRSWRYLRVPDTAAAERIKPCSIVLTDPDTAIVDVVDGRRGTAWRLVTAGVVGQMVVALDVRTHET